MTSVHSPDDSNRVAHRPSSELIEWVSQAECPLALTSVRGRLLAMNSSLAKLIPDTVGGPLHESIDLPRLLMQRCGIRNVQGILDSLRGRSAQALIADRFELSGHADAQFSVVVFPQVFEGHAAYLVWQFEDVRHSHRLEAHEAHAEKMGVISRLAGGMAHEFNNLLTAVLGNLELIRTQPDATIDSVLANIDSAESASLRATHLIDELRRFASRNPPSREVQPVAPIVSRVRQVLAGMAPPHIDVTVSVKGDERALRAAVNSDSLSDALLKLGLNGVEAIGAEPGRVQLLVTESCDESDSGRLVQIEVVDSGHGMSAATRAKAFEPFFTTKGNPLSPGLGMALAHNLIEEMGGAIHIGESNESGSRITVTFPLEPSVADETATVDDDSDQLADRVLDIAVVDDEAEVRSVGRGMLRHLGHNVYTFESGVDLLVAMDEGATFDLIVLDNAMAALSGRATYSQLRNLDARVSVVISSGRNLDLQTFAAPPLTAPVGFLAKPFTLADVVAMLDDCV